MHPRDEAKLLRDAYRVLPLEVFCHLIGYIPSPRPKRYPAGLQKQLETLQRSPKRTPMDLNGLDDFVLSR
jgi:hypothetical protein